MTAADSLGALLGPRCMTDPERIRRYEIPERGEPGHAACVLLPEREDEVGRVLAECSRLGQRVVIAAGRTGLVEAQRPEGEAVLSLEKLRRPLAFELDGGHRFDFPAAGDADAWRAGLLAWWQAQTEPAGASLTVEAGMAVDALNELLAPLGLMWPMEMGSSSSASVGGCVANASAGANAVCYGTAAHLALSASGFWADGKAAGPCTAPVWSAVDPHRLAIDSTRVSLDSGLIGSQGVLGVITQARLRLYRLPSAREAVLLPVDDMPAAMQLLGHACAAFPGGVEEFEFIGAAAIELVRLHQGEAFRWPLEGPPAAPYHLLLQVRSEDPAEDLAGRLYDFLASGLNWPVEQIGYAPLPVLKKLRHSITESSNARMRQLGGGRLSFDTATPVAVFGDYLATLQRELHARYPQVEFVAFGHAGVGGAHLHLLGTREQPVAPQAAELIALVFDVTQRFGGAISAEHGVGPKWAQEYQRRVPAAAREALLAEKRRRDPAGILNPRSFGLVPAIR